MDLETGITEEILVQLRHSREHGQEHAQQHGEGERTRAGAQERGQAHEQKDDQEQDENHSQEPHVQEDVQDDRLEREFLRKGYVLRPGTLGRGSFGVVREAVHRTESRCVAVKVIKLSDINLSTLQMIMFELHVMSHVDHPNITRAKQGWIKHIGKVPHLFITMPKAASNAHGYLAKRSRHFTNPNPSHSQHCQPSQPSQHSQDSQHSQCSQHPPSRQMTSRQRVDSKHDEDHRYHRECPDSEDQEHQEWCTSVKGRVKGRSPGHDSTVGETQSLARQDTQDKQQTQARQEQGAQQGRHSILIKVIVQMYRGLDVLHRQRIVHGDVKPENLLVFEDEGDPRVTLTDFGLSAVIQSYPQIESGSGTTSYMSPDMLFRNGMAMEAKASNDIWAAGLTGLELLFTHLDGKQTDWDREQLDETKLLTKLLGFYGFDARDHHAANDAKSNEAKSDDARSCSDESEDGDSFRTAFKAEIASWPTDFSRWSLVSKFFPEQALGHESISLRDHYLHPLIEMLGDSLHPDQAKRPTAALILARLGREYPSTDCQSSNSTDLRSLSGRPSWKELKTWIKTMTMAMDTASKDYLRRMEKETCCRIFAHRTSSETSREWRGSELIGAAVPSTLSTLSRGVTPMDPTCMCPMPPGLEREARRKRLQFESIRVCQRLHALRHLLLETLGDQKIDNRLRNAWVDQVVYDTVKAPAAARATVADRFAIQILLNSARAAPARRLDRFWEPLNENLQRSGLYRGSTMDLLNLYLQAIFPTSGPGSLGHR